MTTRPTHKDDPADTQMMPIVHSALRRDLVRIRMVLGTPEAAQPRRRTALAEHALWLMHFLHAHHTGEDDGLYPLVVRRNPDAAELVQRMDDDHGAITPAMDRLSAAAQHHLDQPDSPDELLADAIDGLNEVLNPHLEREEQVMMPVVSRSITDAEWRAWDEEFNLKPKGLLELAEEAHWVLDGLDEESSDHVRHVVPPVPRFILLKLLGGRYRRKRSLLWGDTVAGTIPSLSIDASRAWA
jgi:hemerythrin-like domain-containing protein